MRNIPVLISEKRFYQLCNQSLPIKTHNPDSKFQARISYFYLPDKNHANNPIIHKIAAMQSCLQENGYNPRLSDTIVLGHGYGVNAHMFKMPLFKICFFMLIAQESELARQYSGYSRTYMGVMPYIDSEYTPFVFVNKIKTPEPIHELPNTVSHLVTSIDLTSFYKLASYEHDSWTPGI
jgi:hypothetical protein